jgi:hypothetical protein
MRKSAHGADIFRPAVVLLVLILLLTPAGPLFGRSTRQQWSRTSPEINLSHIFEGAINSRGKPTGFHSRPGGRDPRHARLKKIKAGPNRRGVYTAKVEIYDPQSGRWKEKFSTFFPNTMNRQQVIEAVLHAWKQRKKSRGNKWEGPSGRGFTIQGYLNRRGNINTAYPLYRAN